MPANQGKDSRFTVFSTARYDATWLQASPEVGEVSAAVVAAIRLTVVRNVDPTTNEPQSALMLSAWITLPHFSVSSAMNFPNAAGVIDIGSTPKLASRALMRGSATTALISLLSLSITSAGVSFGAPTPYHWLAS